ncbi:hypothetical protein BLOT_004316 [Blomia tropicalis]|nr:hypothetical protein BLOT_004316 [Blomia tropicalis]
MASKSYLGRKLKDLNCMKGQQMYGSVDSIHVPEEHKHNKHFKLFSGFSKKSKKSDQFSVSYEHVPEYELADEKTRLLDGSGPSSRKKRYSNISNDTEIVLADKSKKAKKNVKFNVYEKKENDGEIRDWTGTYILKRKKKKKSGLLKRTGKLIVRTCRYMTYGSPYMPNLANDFPYDSRYPPDYRFYDFEKREWDYSGMSTNNYMACGYSPSAFF